MEWFFYAIIVAILASLLALMEKKELKREHAMQFSAALATICLIVAIPFFFFIDYSLLTWTHIWIIFFFSLIEALAFFFANKGVRHMEVSASAPFLVLIPVVTAILAFFFLGENLTLFQILGIIIIVLGAYILEMKPHHGLLEPFKVIGKSKYVKYIFLALVLFGGAALIDRILLFRLGMQPEAYLAFFNLFVALVFLIMIIIFHNGITDIKEGIIKGGWWILVGAIVTVGARYAWSFAVSRENIALVSTVKRLSALLVVILGGELFREKNILRKVIATVIMMIGVMLLFI
ncbi:MAG: DMT family transporter [Candidatus Woesearchaeota archaeon]|jgi:drug/metabolite transporter (DMT)-like permease